MDGSNSPNSVYVKCFHIAPAELILHLRLNSWCIEIGLVEPGRVCMSVNSGKLERKANGPEKLVQVGHLGLNLAIRKIALLCAAALRYDMEIHLTDEHQLG